MAGNPIGPGTKTLGVNMPKEMAEHLKQWAEREGMSVSQLIKHVLGYAIENDWEVKVVVKAKHPKGK